MDEKDCAKVVKRLGDYLILAAQEFADGISYTLNPDAANWGKALKQKLKVDQMISLQACTRFAPEQKEMWPERFCEEPLATVCARIGLEEILKNSQLLERGEIPTTEAA